MGCVLIAPFIYQFNNSNKLHRHKSKKKLTLRSLLCCAALAPVAPPYEQPPPSNAEKLNDIEIIVPNKQQR